MSNVYAMCDNCGKLYYSGVSIKSSYNIKIEGNIYGECDECQIGNVKSVDGIYSEIDNVMNIVAIDDGKDIEKLYNILNNVTENTSIEEVENKINEETPQYKDIVRIVKDWCDKYEGVFSVVSMIVGMLIALNGYYFDNSTEEDKDIIEQQQKVNEHQQKVIQEQREIIKDYEKE